MIARVGQNIAFGGYGSVLEAFDEVIGSLEELAAFHVRNRSPAEVQLRIQRARTLTGRARSLIWLTLTAIESDMPEADVQAALALLPEPVSHA